MHDPWSSSLAGCGEPSRKPARRPAQDRSRSRQAEDGRTEMKSEGDTLALLRQLYREAGGDPHAIVRVAPLYGNWYNALKFEVVRADHAKTWIWRYDLESGNTAAIVSALNEFSTPAR